MCIGIGCLFGFKKSVDKLIFAAKLFNCVTNKQKVTLLGLLNIDTS